MGKMRHFLRVLFLTVTPLTFSTWADTELAGLRNLHHVNDRVYRSGQPADGDWRRLVQLGIQTVVDLRQDGENNEHSVRSEAAAVRAAGMRYVNVPIRVSTVPTNVEISQLLGILNSGETTLIHCNLGRDRTGTVIAAYRIAHDHWKNRVALREAQSYGLHWYERGMKSYILMFQPPTEGAAIRPGEDLDR